MSKTDKLFRLHDAIETAAGMQFHHPIAPAVIEELEKHGYQLIQVVRVERPPLVIDAF